MGIPWESRGTRAEAEIWGHLVPKATRENRREWFEACRTSDAVGQTRERWFDFWSTVTDWPYRVVQPWGRDKAREATLISEHATAVEAFATVDRLSAEMVRTGAPSDAVELVVIDAAGDVVPRTGVQ